MASRFLLPLIGYIHFMLVMLLLELSNLLKDNGKDIANQTLKRKRKDAERRIPTMCRPRQMVHTQGMDDYPTMKRRQARALDSQADGDW